MFVVVVDFKNDALKAGLLSGNFIKQPVNGATMQIARVMQANASVFAPVDLGALSRSFKIEASPGRMVTFTEAAVYTEMPYAVGINDGRPPPYVPNSGIIDWARRKGISNVGALLRTLYRRGTAPTNFFNNAFNATVSTVDYYLETAANQICTRWSNFK